MQAIQFDKQGHRGCRGLMPENTIPAMLKAVDLGVTTLEMDIVFTADHHLLLSHEPFFHHEITTKPDDQLVEEEEERSLNIYQMTYAETKLFDVGSKSHPQFPSQQKIKVTKPLLTEVIKKVDAYCLHQNVPLVQYNMEIKTQPQTDNLFHPPPEVFVEELMNVIAMHNIYHRVTIQSFDLRPLQLLHRLYPAQKTGLLIEPDDNKTVQEHLTDLGFAPAFYNPHYSLVTKSIIAQCHRLGIKIIPWTVNTLQEMQDLKKMGVDGIITDYPHLFDKLT